MSLSNRGIVEFFSGLGGFSHCLRDGIDVVAVDINQLANAIYAKNFSHRVVCKAIESLSDAFVKSLGRGFWWMSPPCQPYTRRGLGRDLADPRSSGLVRIIGLVGRLVPDHLAIENVPEFRGSESYHRLVGCLEAAGYQWRELILCPTEFGIPNRRRRFFLLASQETIRPWKPRRPRPDICIELEPDAETAGLTVDRSFLDRYSMAIHVLDAGLNRPDVELNQRTTHCFTRAYGRSPVRSGSYLRVSNRVRRFSPREIAAQLGFNRNFRLPDWPAEKLWPLVGNSLSTPCVKYILRHVPELDEVLFDEDFTSTLTGPWTAIETAPGPIRKT